MTSLHLLGRDNHWTSFSRRVRYEVPFSFRATANTLTANAGVVLYTSKCCHYYGARSRFCSILWPILANHPKCICLASQNAVAARHADMSTSHFLCYLAAGRSRQSWPVSVSGYACLDKRTQRTLGARLRRARTSARYFLCVLTSDTYNYGSLNSLLFVKTKQVLFFCTLVFVERLQQ